MDKIKFPLTNEQAELVRPILEKAYRAADKGRSGVVYAQIFQIDGEGEIYAGVSFIKHKKARRMLFALDEEAFIRTVQIGMIQAEEDNK